MKTNMRLCLCVVMWLFIAVNVSAQQRPLKVLSYNILQGMRLDSSANKDAFVAWIKSIDPDILALQEVQKFTQGSLEEMARRFGHPYAVLLKEEGYPVALTSRYPIVNVHKVIDNMHHGMIRAQVLDYSVIVTHFSPHKYWKRREEADLLLATIESQPSQKKWIVMGDLNSLSPLDSLQYTDGKMLAQLKKSRLKHTYHENMVNEQLDFEVIRKFLNKGWVDAVKMKNPEFVYTVPPKKYLEKNPGRHVSRIDYIFVSPDLKRKIKKAFVVKDPFTDYHSDHYPVYLELE